MVISSRNNNDCYYDERSFRFAAHYNNTHTPSDDIFFFQADFLGNEES